jgi:formiminotetrahydrofolate cyclodeaminase
MTYGDDSLSRFIEKTAAPDAVPGGGSVSALAGALAAALSAMVAGLTLKKETFNAVKPRMEALHQKAAALQTELLTAVDRDSESYQAVLTAFRLPKGTDGQAASRGAAIQDAFKGACQVPLQVAEMALQVADLGVQAARDGNPDMITDAGVSVSMARAAVLGALMNVRINLAAIKDPDLVAQMDRKIKQIKRQVIDKEQELFEFFSI